MPLTIVEEEAVHYIAETQITHQEEAVLQTEIELQLLDIALLEEVAHQTMLQIQDTAHLDVVVCQTIMVDLQQQDVHRLLLQLIEIQR